jgi:hypothetical protein
MFRIKHLIPTAAVLFATAGVLAPAAQARADNSFPRFAPAPNSVAIAKAVQRTHNDLAFGGVSRDVVHDTPLANPVEPNVAAGRIAYTSGGIDWTFPVMGAIAVVLILMVAGDQLINRRRGQVAT